MGNIVYYKKKSLILHWGFTEDTMFLYEIFIVYAKGDFEPTVLLTEQPFYCARNEEEAKIKSGAYRKIEPTWDPAGVTIICREIGHFTVAK